MGALGCNVPLMQAPLGRGAGARLAIEVSKAGGLGTLGASWTEPATLREQIRSITRAIEMFVRASQAAMLDAGVAWLSANLALLVLAGLALLLVLGSSGARCAGVHCRGCRR